MGKKRRTSDIRAIDAFVQKKSEMWAGAMGNPGNRIKKQKKQPEKKEVQALVVVHPR